MGYCITVNGEKVWESEGDAMLVDTVSVSNARGEVTRIGSHNQDDFLNIEVNVRSQDVPTEYLDMVEFEKAAARREKFEPAPDTSREGYVAADPETGEPVTQEEAPAPKSSSKKAAQTEAAADVEF